MARLFVAVDLSDEARQAVADEQQRIAGAFDAETKPSLKWVRPEQAHLTIVFLGHVDDERVRTVVDAVGRDVNLAPFEMTLGGVGVFPSRGAPRVLWIGVGDGAAELTVLQRELAARVAALGIPLEQRPFHAHLTLARWRESRAADRSRALAAARPGTIARVRIDSATLYQSRLSPTGAAYTALARANLIPRT
jgi:2'-5' RNA ligase